jgi:hypothetical protein
LPRAAKPLFVSATPIDPIPVRFFAHDTSYFPLGRVALLQSTTLPRVAEQLDALPMQGPLPMLRTSRSLIYAKSRRGIAQAVRRVG